MTYNSEAPRPVAESLKAKLDWAWSMKQINLQIRTIQPGKQQYQNGTGVLPQIQVKAPNGNHKKDGKEECPLDQLSCESAATFKSFSDTENNISDGNNRQDMKYTFASPRNTRNSKQSPFQC